MEFADIVGHAVLGLIFGRVFSASRISFKVSTINPIQLLLFAGNTMYILIDLMIINENWMDIVLAATAQHQLNWFFCNNRLRTKWNCIVLSSQRK